MTQLFDTATYEDLDDTAAGDTARHLRSLPTGGELAARSTQWQLDAKTIESGRKGIQAARQALQDAARSATDKHNRKAA